MKMLLHNDCRHASFLHEFSSVIQSFHFGKRFFHKSCMKWNKVWGSKNATEFHKQPQSEGGMGFKLSNSVVFLLVVVSCMKVTLIDLKKVLVVVCETFLHWFLCCLHEQHV